MRLIQIVEVTVPASSSVVFNHGLNVNGTPVKPDMLQFDRLGSGLDCDPANVTTTTFEVDNSSSDDVTANVLLVAWHTILRVFGNGAGDAFQGLTPQPFVTTTGSAGGGGLSGAEGFTYEVDGTEPDLSEITVTLPTPQASTDYIIFVTQQEATNLLSYAVEDSNKGLNDFVLTLSADATAGDVFGFLVVPLPPA